MSQITMHNSNLQSTSAAKFYSGLKRGREGWEKTGGKRTICIYKNTPTQSLEMNHN